MLPIHIPGGELWDEENNLFQKIPKRTVMLEHSLLSISEWESKWHKPFLSKEEKTTEETYDYIRCMCVSHDLLTAEIRALPEDETKRINDYITDSMTATTFSRNNQSNSREIITSEVIYYMMIRFGIPFDPCQKWHINRLLTLVRICAIKEGSEKKMGRNEILAQNAMLNAQRRAAMHSKG